MATPGAAGGPAATGRHPNRPAHLHFIVAAPGYRPVTTHVFVADSPYLDSDAVFGVKDSLVREVPEVAHHEATLRPHGPHHESSEFRYCTNFVVSGRELAEDDRLAQLLEGVLRHRPMAHRALVRQFLDVRHRADRPKPLITCQTA